MSSVVNYDDALLERYIHQIKNLPTLSAEEELALAYRYRDNGDKEAGKSLVSANLKFVVSVAYKYKHYNQRILDLIQEGNSGLLIALTKFNPDRGYRFIVYAVWWIKCKINEYVVNNHSLIKFKQTSATKRMFFKLRSASSSLERQGILNKQDRTQKLAEYFDVTEQEISAFHLRLSCADFSLDAPMKNEAGELFGTFLDSFASPVDYFEEIVNTQDSIKLKKKLHESMELLSPQEKFVLQRRYLSDEDLSYREVGNELKVSRQRIQQIEKSAIGKLKPKLLAEGYDEEVSSEKFH